MVRVASLKYLLAILLSTFCQSSLSKECVILLHGLVRSAASMGALEERLVHEGYYVRNIDYPSRDYPIEILAEEAVGRGMQGCEQEAATKINFVTHSLGGILVRMYLKKNNRKDIYRVVMLGPPNQGSEVVDRLKNTPGFELLNGPAGMQLGTKTSDIPKSLGPVDFELGVIAGTQSINLILSTFLPNPDDGKVSVESTKVTGMRDFVALPVTHPLMMKNEAVIEQTVHFLRYGSFSKR
ncbi:MAG: alpha/beta hydrolase [Gammaproteobacteria bacterium]|nr:alpha/beta hydrolase [Gammaproteobacteria bacterium]